MEIGHARRHPKALRIALQPDHTTLAEEFAILPKLLEVMLRPHAHGALRDHD